MDSSQKTKAASCFLGGAEYSDGAIVCQAGQKLRCNDGTWQETGDNCFEGIGIGKEGYEIITVSEVRIIRTDWTSKSIQTAVVRIEQKNGKITSSFPTIKISNPNIHITIKNAPNQTFFNYVSLNGDGGNYNYSSTGNYQVTPGTYKTSMNGTLVGDGYFEADIDYS